MTRLPAMATLLLAALMGRPASAASTLDRVAASGQLTVGYIADARPFSYTDEAGKPAGYAVALCNQVGEAVRSELRLPALAVKVTPVPFGERFREVDRGAIDLLCGAEPTLERRALVDFSIPIMLNGVGVAIRSDAPPRLRQLLSGQEPKAKPLWRGSQGQAPERHVVAVIGGTTLEQALVDRLRASRIVVEVVPVGDNQAGLRMLLQRRADAFFSDRALLLDAVRRSAEGGQLAVLDRIFKRGQVALAVQRNDDRFRLLVDRTLSRLMRSGEMAKLYGEHFGAPDRGQLNLFQLVALPE